VGLAAQVVVTVLRGAVPGVIWAVDRDGGGVVAGGCDQASGVVTVVSHQTESIRHENGPPGQIVGVGGGQVVRAEVVGAAGGGEVLGDADVAELGFKIENEDTSIEKVKNILDKNKIEDVTFFYQQRAEEREKLVSRLNAGEIKEAELEKISSELDATFQENCRSILTDEEYKMIFTNQAQR